MLLERVESHESKDAFEVRPPTMADLEDVVELTNACSARYMGRPEITASRLRAEWQFPQFDLARNARVVLTPEGQIVAYEEYWDGDDPPVRIMIWGRVHPDYEGMGIGTHLMEWAEEQARLAAATVPAGIQVVMEAGALVGYESARELFSSRGMRPVRRFYTMAITLDGAPPPPSWPPGIQVRPMNGASELLKVVAASHEAFRDHWGHTEMPLEQVYERWHHIVEHHDDFDPGLWFLALDADEIAGLCLCWPKADSDPEMGWVGTLGVRRPWRRQGLGLALLQHSFGEFYRRGMGKAGLGVDANSLTGATRLYEKAGMSVLRQFDLYQKVLRPGRDVRTRALEAQE